MILLSSSTNTESVGKMKFPQHRALFFLMRLHAAQNIVKDFYGRNDVWPFIQHDAFRALSHRRVRNFRP